MISEMPFVVLSATSPLVQVWLARDAESAPVHRLYAVSNIASMAGLVLYVAIIEPLAGVRIQSWIIWAIGTIGLVAALRVARDDRRASIRRDRKPHRGLARRPCRDRGHRRRAAAHLVEIDGLEFEAIDDQDTGVPAEQVDEDLRLGRYLRRRTCWADLLDGIRKAFPIHARDSD